MIIAEQYLPHEKPMVFVDHLVEVTESYAIAELRIQPELMFIEPEGLPTWASIELMAQTVSAYSGYRGHALGKAPKIGFLLGTRKLNFAVPYFAMGSIVTIKVEQGYTHEGLGQFSCEIEYLEHRFKAVLSVFEPQDINQINGNTN